MIPFNRRRCQPPRQNSWRCSGSKWANHWTAAIIRLEKKPRGYETSREENLDSIRPEQPFETANLPPSGARATTFALILDKSEPSSQLIRTAVIEIKS